MNEPLQPFDTDHVEHSVGGFAGHALRRATHIVMAFIPLIYYTRGDLISDKLGMNPDQLVSAIIITLIFIEALRIKMGIVVFCLLYTSPSPRDQRGSRMPSSA